MCKISWSEFIIVWLTVCIVIDMVLIYLNKKNGTKCFSESEDRKAIIRQLNTPYRDDISYEVEIRRASMIKVAALAPMEETLQVDSSVENEDEGREELTELQQETSDIVKMLFG